MSKESVKKQQDNMMLGMVGFIIGAAVTVFAKHMFMGNQFDPDNNGMNWPFTIWWLFFCACNMAYLIRGLRKGYAKADAANGLLIAVGPVVFYAWTFMYVWKKYVRKEKLEL